MIKIKSIIPFSKELDFSTKLSEITSISLEREFSVMEGAIDGNLFVTGDYKSHEVSANVIPFSYKIPFSIDIPIEIDSNSVHLEISDFAYDIISENKIRVNIELELEGEEKPEEEEEEVIEPVMVDTEEIIKMMESDSEELKEDERNDTIDDEIIANMEVTDIKERQEEIIKEEQKEEEIKEEIAIEDQPNNDIKDENNIIEINSNIKENDEMILENIKNEEEYATYHIHIVKDGENVETICTMYNSNLSMLTDYNDLSNISPGEKIIIPYNDEQ